MSLVRPILEYVAACWNPHREGQISALDRVQKKAVTFAHHKNSSNWETLFRVESYHAYVPSSKPTLGNARRSLLVTD